MSLLPDSVFLTAVSGLMHHDLPTVQCKAMELLTNKLQHGKDVGKRTLQVSRRLSAAEGRKVGMGGFNIAVGMGGFNIAVGMGGFNIAVGMWGFNIAVGMWGLTLQ